MNAACFVFCLVLSLLIASPAHAEFTIEQQLERARNRSVDLYSCRWAPSALDLFTNADAVVCYELFRFLGKEMTRCNYELCYVIEGEHTVSYSRKPVIVQEPDEYITPVEFHIVHLSGDKNGIAGCWIRSTPVGPPGGCWDGGRCHGVLAGW